MLWRKQLLLTESLINVTYVARPSYSIASIMSVSATPAVKQLYELVNFVDSESADSEECNFS